MQPSTTGESLVSIGGLATKSVPAGAANTVVKASAGRLCRVVVTTAGTTAATFFDNATTNSGTVIGVTPATTTVGQIFDLAMPAELGIVCQNTATGPVVTVSFI